MVYNHEDETSYTDKYHEAFLKYVENQYCCKHRRVPVKKHECYPSSILIHSAPAPGSCHSSFDPCELYCDDEEYSTPNDVAEMTPGRSDCAPHLLTAGWLYLNSLPEEPKNWGQLNPNINDYHSDPIEISSTFSLPDITDCWSPQADTHSKNADLSDVARDLFCIIPHRVGVEASFSLGRDVIGWRQSKTTCESLRKTVVARLFARANEVISTGANSLMDTRNTENDTEMKKEAEEWQLHTMAKIHDCLEMWRGCQNLRATQKESGTHNKRMTTVRYISDTEEILKASWSLFQHDGANALISSERSLLRPPLSTKEVPGGLTHILNVRRIGRNQMSSSRN